MNGEPVHLVKTASKSRQQKAVALIMVLSVLSLLTMMVLSVFIFSRTELASSTQFSSARKTEVYAESAINMVIAQIRRATQYQDGSNAYAWATQPGAIRSWNSQGTFHRGYKLYSSDRMMVTQESDLYLDQPPADWRSRTQDFVDLNQPVIRDQTLYFPIIDPRVTADEIKVDGFSYDTGSAQWGAVAANSVDDPNARLPMPVRWQYLLEDGTPGVLDASGKFVSASGVKATRENPIVGRVAYWADDDTSKVNLNTASEPTFWDTPRVYGSQNADFDTDWKYGRYQPTMNEFQRFPAHPATTSLSGALFRSTSLTQAQKETLYSILPRVEPGGTKGATNQWISNSVQNRIKPDADRLYHAPAEMLFRPWKQGDSNAAPRTYDANLLSLMGFSGGGGGDALARSLALREPFLTTHSRAPEVTLYGTPRMSIWPIADERRPNADSWSIFDRMIQFCSTLGSNVISSSTDGRTQNPDTLKEYLLRREDEDSMTLDFTGRRNENLYRYLQSLTSRNVPGFGGNFLTKYGADRDQILTEIFDYIRSTNLHDDTLEKNWNIVNPNTGNAHAQYTDGRTAGVNQTALVTGFGQVMNLRPKSGAGVGTMGFGRIYTISEVSLHFIATADPDADPESNVPANNNTLNGTVLSPGQKRVQMGIYFEVFSPMVGWNPIQGEYSFRVRKINGFSVNNQKLKFENTASEVPLSSTTSTGNIWHERRWGGTTGFRSMLAGKDSWGFIADPVTVNSTGTMNFSGGSFEVEIRGTWGTVENSVQTIQIDFPAGNFPVPELVRTGTPLQLGSTDDPTSVAASETNKRFWWTLKHAGIGGGSNKGRLHRDHIGQDPGSHGNPRAGAVIRAEDVVRSLVPWHGDYRLVAASTEVPATVFQPVKGYFSATQKHAHQLRTSASSDHHHGYSATDPAQQMIVSTGNFGGYRPDFPDVETVPPGEDASKRTRVRETGDFDNAPGVIVDGAYVNKPDEGNYYRLDLGQTPYYDENWTQSSMGASYFTPNRMMPSPGMFGSLPTGVKAGKPWQTLLFRPQPNHPSNALNGPKDHLIMDLFWMPVVQPYAISDPGSTAGKVNMNYQILPFTHIKRTTALRSVLKGEQILAVPTNDANVYKSHSQGRQYRYPINLDETLKQWDEVFSSQKAFISATQICDQHLVPNKAGTTLATMRGNFWADHALTGDNSRERPYTNLYPRLTTQSNTFKVYYCAQAIKKSRTVDPEFFDPEKDQVLSEIRGSTLLERYLDTTLTSGSDAIVDFARSENYGKTLDPYYKIRVIEQKRFNP